MFSRAASMALPSAELNALLTSKVMITQYSLSSFCQSWPLIASFAIVITVPIASKVERAFREPNWRSDKPSFSSKLLVFYRLFSLKVSWVCRSYRAGGIPKHPVRCCLSKCPYRLLRIPACWSRWFPPKTAYLARVCMSVCGCVVLKMTKKSAWTMLNWRIEFSNLEFFWFWQKKRKSLKYNHANFLFEVNVLVFKNQIKQ